MRKVIFIGVFLMISAVAVAQQGGFGKERTGRSNPFRVYYFSYDLANPGVYLGPELDFLWTKSEKIKCETGFKLVDKKLLFIPNFGAVFQRNSILNLFVGLEVDYRVIYHKGGVFELFSGLGYTHQFGNEFLPSDAPLEDVLAQSKGFLMPTFGIGGGYDLRKAGHNIPVLLSGRLLTTSLDLSDGFFQPSFHLGATIGFHR